MGRAALIPAGRPCPAQFAAVRADILAVRLMTRHARNPLTLELDCPVGNSRRWFERKRTWANGSRVTTSLAPIAGRIDPRRRAQQILAVVAGWFSAVGLPTVYRSLLRRPGFFWCERH